MRYSTVPAIDFDAHVNRNRAIIRNARTLLDESVKYRVWHDGEWIVNPIFTSHREAN